MRANFWSILGIEPTDDKKVIKRAYAKQSRIYHPEEQPEAFQSLQEAYQAALAYQAKQKRQSVLVKQSPLVFEEQTSSGKVDFFDLEQASQNHVDKSEPSESEEIDLDFDWSDTGRKSGDRKWETVANLDALDFSENQTVPEPSSLDDWEELGKEQVLTEQAQTKVDELGDWEWAVDSDQSPEQIGESDWEETSNLPDDDLGHWEEELLVDHLQLDEEGDSAIHKESSRSLFKPEIEAERQRQEGFLLRLMEQLPEGFTAEQLEPWLVKAKDKGYLTDTWFTGELEDLLIMRVYDARVGNLLRLRRLYNRYHLQRLFELFNNLLISKGYPLKSQPLEQVPPKTTAKSKTTVLAPQSSHPRTTQRSGFGMGYGLLVLIFLVFKLFTGFDRVLPTAYETSRAAQSSLPPSVLQELNQAQSSSVSAFLKSLVTKPELYEEAGTYYLKQAVTGQSIPLTDMTQAMVLPLEGSSERTAVVAATSDGQTWTILDQDGQPLGSLVAPLTASSILVWHQEAFSVK